MHECAIACIFSQLLCIDLLNLFLQLNFLNMANLVGSCLYGSQLHSVMNAFFKYYYYIFNFCMHTLGQCTVFNSIERGQYIATENTRLYSMNVFWGILMPLYILLHPLLISCNEVLKWILVMVSSHAYLYKERNLVLCMVQHCVPLEIKVVLHFYFIDNFPSICSQETSYFTNIVIH